MGFDTAMRVIDVSAVSVFRVFTSSLPWRRTKELRCGGRLLKRLRGKLLSEVIEVSKAA